MGIPGLQTWLRKRYPEAFGTLGASDGFDHVYFDLPSTLHIVTRSSRSRNDFHSKLHSRLDWWLKYLGPSQRIIFAMDGPAPLAKLLEQRRRRQKEENRSNNAELGPVEASSATSKARRAPSSVSQTLLTTGTVFMLEVHSSVMSYVCHRLFEPRFRAMTFEISDSTVQGEGELKILSRLVPPVPRGGKVKGEDEVKGEGESHAVVGGDSDLLLMITIAGRRNVVMCFDERASNKGVAAFYRDKLEETWRKEHLPPDATQADVTELGLNLALLAIMGSGNDYLPACKGLQLQNNRRPGLWNLFLDMKAQPEWEGQTLVRCCKQRLRGRRSTAAVELNRPMLAALIERYVEQGSFTVACFEKGLKPKGVVHKDIVQGAWMYGRNATTGEPLIPLPLLSVLSDNADSMEASLSDGSTEIAGVEGMEGSGSDADQPWRCPADAAAYVDGLEWVMGMYATGSLDDYRYNYPGSSPSLDSMLECLDPARCGAGAEGGDVSSEAGEKLSKTSGAAMRRSIKEPLFPGACALALLPASGRQQAATPLRHLMDADSPVAEIYEVCSECQHISARARVASKELEVVRQEIAQTLAEMAAAVAVDSEAALDVAGEATLAAARCEERRLKGVLRDLSRSQLSHLREKHPYKPFPTAELEAAAAAVPLDAYPFSQRKLAQFGREVRVRWKSTTNEALERELIEKYTQVSVPPPPPATATAPATTTTADASESVLKRPTLPPQKREGLPAYVHVEGVPGWLQETSRFVHFYPRVGKQDVLRGAADLIVREVLPMQSYQRTRRWAGGKLPEEQAKQAKQALRRPNREPPSPLKAPMGAEIQAFASSQPIRSPAVTTRAVATVSASSGVVGWRPLVGPFSMQTAMSTCARVLPRLRCFGRF